MQWAPSLRKPYAPLAFLACVPYKVSLPAVSRAGPLPGLQWAPSRRKAYALMAFGLVVGALCTRATLQAVHTEGQVVSLAKELVQQEQQVL